MLDALLAEQDTQTWVSCFEEAGIPCSAVQNISEMLAHEQTQSLGLLQAVPDSGMAFIGLPLSFDGVRPAIRSRPPAIGEHTAEIFKRKN
jgi:crotonobetainyl-CoA:carnitine CoA-transferase CaiB-like acyl-CoA transferase